MIVSHCVRLVKTRYKPSNCNAWIWYFVIENLNTEGMYLMYYQAVVCLKLCYVCAGDIVELFMRYFRNFGDKSCCVSDLKMFLPLLPNNRTKDFIQNINETVGLNAGELPSSVRLHEKDVAMYSVTHSLWKKYYSETCTWNANYAALQLKWLEAEVMFQSI